MNFFFSLHRSIFDSLFYKEVLSSRKSKVFGFLVKQILFITIISAATQVYYLTDSKRGIVDNIINSFSGMEIKSGILYPNRKTPYIPPSNEVTSILEQLMGIPLLLGDNTDSLFIIDTSSSIHYPLKLPVFLLRSDRLELMVNPKTTVVASYNKLFPVADYIVFTHEFVDNYLKRHSLFFFAQMFMGKLLITTLFLLFCVIFIALAAYFFRIDKSRSFKQHLKISFFAISPITVGSILVALAGVKISWIWNILIFISTIVMFRAMLSAGTPVQSEFGDNE